MMTESRHAAIGPGSAPSPADLPEPARRLLADLLAGVREHAPPGQDRQALAQAGWLTARDGALIPSAGLLFGCDVGGTKVHSVLADLSGTILAEEIGPTAPEGGMALVAQISGHLGRLSRQAGVRPDQILAAGIGVPGAVHPQHGTLSRIPNIAGVDGPDFIPGLTTALGLPLVIENDVNLAAMAEQWLGHRGESLAFIALGTGIGMGIMLGDRLLRGAHGGAGEIAALPIGADPFDPATRPIGALESMVSGAALRAAYRSATGRPGADLAALFADPSDPAFARVIDDLGRHLALAVLSVASVIDPRHVVLGGSIGAQPRVLAALRHHLARCMDTPPLCLHSALGTRAGVLGAVRAARSLAAEELLRHPSRQQVTAAGG